LNDDEPTPLKPDRFLLRILLGFVLFLAIAYLSLQSSFTIRLPAKYLVAVGLVILALFLLKKAQAVEGDGPQKLSCSGKR
jgi:hypothetical protein